MQQLLISDANILIDMEEGELLTQLFQLPYLFAIPDILFVEELEEEHAHLPDMGLTLEELSPDSMMHAMELIPLYLNASRNDIFALCLAKQKNCPLVTGDMALRKAAEKEGIVVQGTISLITQLVRQQIGTKETALKAYEKMKLSGRRLPWKVALEHLNAL